MDFGAGETVGPKSIASHIPIVPSPSSTAGISYVAANGTKIANYGEKKLRGLSSNGVPKEMKMQVADVKKLLTAVSAICDSGNKVVFDNEGSYIESKATGQRTQLRRENGVYRFDMWVKKIDNESNVNSVFMGQVEGL